MFNATTDVNLVGDENEFGRVDLGSPARQPGGKSVRVKLRPPGERVLEEVEHVVEKVSLLVTITISAGIYSPIGRTSR